MIKEIISQNVVPACIIFSNHVEKRVYIEIDGVHSKVTFVSLKSFCLLDIRVVSQILSGYFTEYLST